MRAGGGGGGGAEARVGREAAMLGSLVTRISGLSPGGSPRPARRRRPRSCKDEFREIQSEPEDSPKKDKTKSRRRIEKMRARRMEVSAPLQGSKSLGRLDGLKEVGRSAPVCSLHLSESMEHLIPLVSTHFSPQ